MTARRRRLSAVGSILAAAALAAGPAAAAPKPSASPPPVYPNVVEEIPSHLGIQNDHQREWLRRRSRT